MTNSSQSAPDVYLDPTSAQLEGLLGAGIEGPVTMLNLLRYAPVADYSQSPELAPTTPISGREAYGLYSAGVLPIAADLGGELLLFGPCYRSLIGPESEQWDEIVLISWPNVDALISMTTSAEYLEISGHRVAALIDSRLVPTGAIAP